MGALPTSFLLGHFLLNQACLRQYIHRSLRRCMWNTDIIKSRLPISQFWIIEMYDLRAKQKLCIFIHFCSSHRCCYCLVWCCHCVAFSTFVGKLRCVSEKGPLRICFSGQMWWVLARAWNDNDVWSRDSDFTAGGRKSWFRHQDVHPQGQSGKDKDGVGRLALSPGKQSFVYNKTTKMKR